MLLELKLDHNVLKLEAEERGYSEQCFTESLYCQVVGYQVVGSDEEAIWNVSGFSEFYYCEVVVTVESATIEDGYLCIHHSGEDYPDSPIRVPIASAAERDRYPSILPTVGNATILGVMTTEEWKAFATDFLTRKGLDVWRAEWIDIETAIRHHSGRTGVSKKFLTDAARALRGGVDCL